MLRLDLLLYDSARRLRIDVLIGHMRAFAASLDMEDPRAGQLRDAATRLLLLKSEIETLLTSHDNWQRIDEDLWICELMKQLQFTPSTSEARRLVSQGAVRIAGPGTDARWCNAALVDAFAERCPTRPGPVPPDAITAPDFPKVTRSILQHRQELKVRATVGGIAYPIEKLSRLQ
jgi:hypothetical protein